jgi:hypothetical protein
VTHHLSPITSTTGLRLEIRDGEIDQPVAYACGVCQSVAQLILIRQTSEMRMAVLDHRHGEQSPAWGVLHQGGVYVFPSAELILQLRAEDAALLVA